MKWLFLTLLIANMLVFMWLFPGQQTHDAVVPVADEDRGLPRLVLVSELAAGQKQQASGEAAGQAASEPVADSAATVVAEQSAGAQADETQPEQARPAAVVQCFRIGPYAEAALANKSRDLLIAAGWQGDRSELRDRVLVGMRVMLPGPVSEAQARNSLNALQRKGIRDIAVIRDDGQYIVSLGFYSQQSSVTRRQQELARLGYQVRTAPSYRESVEYWLNVARADGQQELQQVWDRLVKLAPGIRSSKTNCR